MPVNLSIKGVPDAIAAALRSRAASNHRSLQRELMAIIEVAATSETATSHGSSQVEAGESVRRSQRVPRSTRSNEEVFAEFHKIFPHVNDRGPSSTQIIREMRDGRYGEAWLKAQARRKPR